MEGDWMAEARNGTTDLLDRMARLPGLQKTFDKVSEIKEDKVMSTVRENHAKQHTHDESPGHHHGHEHHTHGDCGAHMHRALLPEEMTETNIAMLHEELKKVRE
mmetsp:Transcript_1006/g.1680  ORF Transcript_1006/g.1680 Transcript_1006/m.1680 type:complete len:104 (-) Transcript_1006:2094-2405(-)